MFVEDKGVRQKLINICNPLELGKIESTDKTHFVLDSFWKNHFNRMLAQSGQPNPTVADLRRWTDQPDERGLPKEDPEPADSGLRRSDEPLVRAVRQ